MDILLRLTSKRDPESFSSKSCNFIATSSEAGLDLWQWDWRHLFTKECTGSQSLSLRSSESCLAKKFEGIENRWLGFWRSLTALVFHNSVFNSFTTDLSVCSLNLSKFVWRGISSETWYRQIDIVESYCNSVTLKTQKQSLLFALKQVLGLGS